jgi:hypothetical protein
MCSASAYAVWVPDSTCPSEVTKAAANADRIFASSSRYAAASSGRPATTAISVIKAAS